MRQFNLIPVALLASFLASQALADPLDDAIALFRRQSVDLSTGVTTTTDSTDETTTLPDPTTTAITTPTGDNDDTTTPTDDTNTVPAPSTVIETSTSTRSNSETTPTDNSDSQQTEQSTEETQATSRTRVTSSFTSQVLTTFTTVTDGSTMIGTSTQETVIPTETEVDPSSLSDGDSNGGGSSGLSDTAKKTIGGVVGGVGGALLLAGLAYTAWRVWGKKKNLHDDDLYDPNIGQDKLSSSTADNTSTATPFNRTLDQYHQPGPVNQASNF